MDKQSINGYVLAQRFQNGKYRFRVFRKDLLAIYGFDHQGTQNAFKVQATINFFDQSIYEKNTYNITDLRQVGKDAGNVATEGCMTITDEVEIWFDPDGDADPCDCSGNEYYVRTETTTYTFCWTTGGDGGGSGGGGSGDGGAGGGGSGDGGDGSDTEDNHWEYADYVPGSGIVASEANPNLEDDDPDMAYWYYEYEPGTFPPQVRPSYAAMYAAYPKDASGNDMPGPEVYQLVGGTPLAFYNADPEHYNNACALRVSRALNYCNVKIPRIQGETFQGNDGKFYFLSAAKLYAWLKATFGTPNMELTNGGTDGQNFRTGLTGKKGIYLMQPNYPKLFGATGHASLWDGSKAIGNHDYFDAEGGTAKVALWILN
ncbi:T6SS effector amidase Tae4 family protein [Chitinophaga japonensis]|uniref:T6SS effector amidase Tae4 family protein n=1 Tax=Chitinophaga japonensis TaxID=104662 RepID=UPI0011A96F12|nr:T6SS effector amidase Tae4 family protein [Chitinophaga japonensis]